MSDINIILAAERTKEFLPVPDTAVDIESVTSSHLEYMLESIISSKVKNEKAHRWLGWVQGIICCKGAATLTQMKNINSGGNCTN